MKIASRYFLVAVATLWAGATAIAQENIDPKMEAVETCLVKARIDPDQLANDLSALSSAQRDVLVACLRDAGIGPWDFARAAGEPMHPL